MTRTGSIVSFLLLAVSLGSCRTLTSTQTSVVRKFAATSKEVTPLPFTVMVNYYETEFKANQLDPENYVIHEAGKQDFDQLAENAMQKIEGIRQEYYSRLRTAGEIKSVYDLLQTYILSLEKLADDHFARDFEKKSVELGTRMNGLVSKLSSGPQRNIRLGFNPGQWLSSLVTAYGRTRLKTRQATYLREYITRADTLVQSIAANYHELQAPYVRESLVETEKNLRGQFKQSIAPYLQYFNRHPDSTTTIVAMEFYSRIIPVYYELTDEIRKNRLLVDKADSLLANLAGTHSRMKDMFASRNNWVSVLEEVNGLKDQLALVKTLFDKDNNGKSTTTKNSLLENEDLFKALIDR